MAESGLIKGLIIGITALIITVIVSFVVVSNVEVVDDSITFEYYDSVINETGGWLNRSNAVNPYSLAKTSATGFGNPVITSVVNITFPETLLESGNYTVSSAGVLTNASDIEYLDIVVTYSYSWTPTEATADNMISNYTSGIDNISSKVPTVLLIAAIILILGILTLLWNTYKGMGINNFGGGL